MSDLQRDYPHLLFRTQWKLDNESINMLGQCEAYVNAIKNTPILPHHYRDLMNVSLIKGAQATTAIEGNTLSDLEVQKVKNGERLPPSKEYQEIEVNNILRAFYELFHDEEDHFISIQLLLRFHKLVGKNLKEHFQAIPGQLRNSDVTVGSYRCPDYRDVPVLLDDLCRWLRSEFGFKEKEQKLGEVIIQAIVTHVYIEWIHPFGDGNGRTGRLVEFYILIRGGMPNIASHILSNHYNLTRSAYYRQLDNASRNRDLSEFIKYALLGLRDGLVGILEIIQQSQFETAWHKLIYDKFDTIKVKSHEEAFKRRRNLAVAIPVEGEYDISQIQELNVKIAKAYSSLSSKTLERDLSILKELEIIKITDKGNYTTNSDVLRSMTALVKEQFKKE